MMQRIHAAWLMPVMLLAAAPAWGVYTNAYFVDGTTVQSTFYDADTGVLDLVIDNDPILILADPLYLPGPIQNVSIRIVSALDRAGEQYGAAFVLFRGGTIRVAFEHDSGAGFQAYELSGRIQMLSAQWTNLSSTQSRLDIYGAWYPEVVELPGSNNWPNGGLRCTLDSFSIRVPSGAGSWDPQTQSLTGRALVQGSLYPNWGPLSGVASGDVDHDCDVDLADFAGWMRCREDDGLSAAEVLNCLDVLDADYNAVVDEMDFPSFVDLLSGPQPCGGDLPAAAVQKNRVSKMFSHLASGFSSFSRALSNSRSAAGG